MARRCRSRRAATATSNGGTRLGAPPPAWRGHLSGPGNLPRACAAAAAVHCNKKKWSGAARRRGANGSAKRGQKQQQCWDCACGIHCTNGLKSRKLAAREHTGYWRGGRRRGAWRPLLVRAARPSAASPHAAAASGQVQAVGGDAQGVEEVAPAGRLLIKDVGHGLHQHAAAANLRHRAAGAGHGRGLDRPRTIDGGAWRQAKHAHGGMLPARRAASGSHGPARSPGRHAGSRQAGRRASPCGSP